LGLRLQEKVADVKKQAHTQEMATIAEQAFSTTTNASNNNSSYINLGVFLALDVSKRIFFGLQEHP
jgi:hypothetical protein